MNIDDLFPNSLEKKIDQLRDVYMTPSQRAALDNVIEYARQYQRLQVPVSVEVAEPTPWSDYYQVHVVRDETKELVHITRVAGSADYYRDLWKHILLGWPLPNKAKYDLDPTRKCSTCGHKQTIHTDNIKCQCVPF